MLNIEISVSAGLSGGSSGSSGSGFGGSGFPSSGMGSGGGSSMFNPSGSGQTNPSGGQSSGEKYSYMFGVCVRWVGGGRRGEGAVHKGDFRWAKQAQCR